MNHHVLQISSACVHFGIPVNTIGPSFGIWNPSHFGIPVILESQQKILWCPRERELEKIFDCFHGFHERSIRLRHSGCTRQDRRIRAPKSSATSEWFVNDFESGLSTRRFLWWGACEILLRCVKCPTLELQDQKSV